MSGPLKRILLSEASSSKAKVKGMGADYIETFKVATGGLDPRTMTLDDLGSDFSDEG
jgi:hypothetical protein